MLYKATSRSNRTVSAEELKPGDFFSFDEKDTDIYMVVEMGSNMLRTKRSEFEIIALLLRENEVTLYTTQQETRVVRWQMNIKPEFSL